MSSKSEYITFTESERVFSRKDLIERQARKEAKAFFDKIREWNIKQIEPHLEALDPHIEEPLPLMERAIL